MSLIPRPDHSQRPLTMTCEYCIKAGTLAMNPEPGRPYFFYHRDGWGRHPHYGRFLDLRQNELVEMTWMTGALRGPQALRPSSGSSSFPGVTRRRAA